MKHLSILASMALALSLVSTPVPAAEPLGLEKLATQNNILYGEAGGQKLYLDVMRPKDSLTSLPAIVLVHGGGWSAGSKEVYHRDALRFAQQGYACFCVGYRLVRPDTNKFPAQLDDVQLAVRWVRAHAADYNVAPTHVGAIGASAGGHLVSLLGTCDTRDPKAPLADFSSRPQCIVDVFGPTDFTADFPTSGPYSFDVQKLVNDLLGKPVSQAGALLKEASPLYHVDQKTVPFLIVHGTLDVLVPLDQSYRMRDALKKAGRHVEYLEVPGGGHGFTPQQDEKVYQTVLDFFNRQLK